MSDFPIDNNRTLPAMPRGMSPQAKKLWKAYAAELDSNGLLTPLDGMGFTMMVLMYDLAWDSYQDVKENGSYSYNAHGNQVKRPAFGALTESCSQFLRFAMQFGMTPVSRSKLKVEAASIDEYEAFLSAAADGEK